MATLNSASPGCSGENISEASRPKAGATSNHTSPGSSGETSSAPLAAINHTTTTKTTKQPIQYATEPFARYLVICHSDRNEDILKFNPYAIQKALTVLIGDKFVCTRYERSKFVEIFVRSQMQSETLLNLKELDCTEYKIPVSVTKHKTKNTCKGVIHCDAIGRMYSKKSELLKDMAKDNVIDIFRLSKTVNGVTNATNTYFLTFDSETRPRELNMGFGLVIPVLPHYPNPRLCMNCQRYGHGSNNCRNKPICANCGSETHTSDICENEPSCLHCTAKHSSSTKTCPKFLIEKRVLKTLTDCPGNPVEVRKQVYRDSQDLVSKIPSLSSFVKASYSSIVSNNSNTIPANQSNTRQPSSQAPSVDPSAVIDHPSFKALQAQHESTKVLLEQMRQEQADQQKTTNALLAQMQQQQRSNDEQMSIINKLFGILMTAQSSLPPATLQAIQNLMSQPTQLPQLHILPNTIHTPTSLQNQQTVSMDTTSSSKRSHSASSEDGISDNPKKVASDKSSDRQDMSVAAPVPQDKGAQAEQPKTASASPPASVPQNTGAQVGQRKSHLPVQDKPGTRKTDGRGQSDPKGGNKPAVAKKGDSKPVVPIKKPSLSRGAPPGSTSRTDLN